MFTHSQQETSITRRCPLQRRFGEEGERVQEKEKRDERDRGGRGRRGGVVGGFGRERQGEGGRGREREGSRQEEGEQGKQVKTKRKKPLRRDAEEVGTTEGSQGRQGRQRKVGVKKLLRMGLVPARTWRVHAVGTLLTERFKLRRQMAAAAGKKSTTSLSLFMEEYSLEHGNAAKKNE